MTTIYIGRQWRTEQRQWLLDVVADSLEEAQVKFNAGEGRPYAYVESLVDREGPVTDVHEDMNDGMGR